jgi:hypothetical protein
MGNSWDNRPRGGDRGALSLGVVLIAFGAVFLASEQLNLDLGRYGWPMFVIVPGLVMLALGLVIPNEAGLGLAIPGAIVTTVGLILLFQDTTGAYASWSYAWALVAPGSVGVALVAYGILHRKGDLIDAGLRTLAVGIGLFVGFGLFFENVIGLDPSGDTTTLRSAFPLMAVALGIVIVLLNVVPPRTRVEAKTQSSAWHSEEASPSPATTVGDSDHTQPK